MNKLIVLVAIAVVLLTVTGCRTLFGNSSISGGISNTPGESVIGSDALSNVVYKTNWLVTASILGIAASAAAFVTGQSYALPIFAACSAALTTVLSVTKYAEWIAVGGMAVSVGIFIYLMIKRNRDDKKVKTAFEEVVEGTQRVKEWAVNRTESGLTREDSKVKTRINGILSRCQHHNETKDLVKGVKNGMEKGYE